MGDGMTRLIGKVHREKVSGIDNFGDELDCLVTCKMLNEGVDVPSLNTVILVSSDGGAEGLVTTQRIGRALRYDEDNPKKMARVIDFVRTNIKEGENEWERTEWLEELSKIRPDGWSD